MFKWKEFYHFLSFNERLCQTDVQFHFYAAFKFLLLQISCLVKPGTVLEADKSLYVNIFYEYSYEIDFFDLYLKKGQQEHLMNRIKKNP